MTDQPVDVRATASLAIAVSARTIELLQQKGVITRDEALALYSKALDNQHPELVEDGKRILKAMMPGLTITR